MAELNDVRVFGYIGPPDSTDTFATHDSLYGRGGWHEAANHADRNAITHDRRRAGMAVKTLSDGLTWILNPEPWVDNDTDWTEDPSAAGLTLITPGARAATTAALTATYSNGTAGVGATLTNSGTQAALVIDGVTLAPDNVVLVKDQAAPAQNGFFTVTDIGSVSTNWVLTRGTNYDAPDEVVQGSYTAVGAGTINVGTLWIMTAVQPVTIGTDAISFTRLIMSGTGTVTSVSVVTANGVSGTVANPTTNAAITLSVDGTPVSGLPAATSLGGSDLFLVVQGGVSKQADYSLITAGAGTGTVTTVSVVTANGVSGTVATDTTTPAITIVLGAITPSSVNASGTMAGSNLSGTNTGDQTITLTNDVTGSGTGSFSTAIKTNVALAGSPTTTTQSPGDNSTKIATTAFVTAAVTAAGGLPSGTDGQILTTDGATPSFSSVGLRIDQHYGAIGVASIVATVAAIDLSLHDWYSLTLDNAATTTLVLSNPTVGQQFALRLIQDGTGGCLVNWFTTIRWEGGSAPTLSTTPGAINTIVFKCVGAGAYDGFVASGGAGTVTTVSVVTANGISGTVATATTTPAITLTLGAITPASIVASGAISGSNLSGTNTGDQTITLTSDVTGSGVGSFATTIKSSVALAGNPTTTTQSPGNNSTRIATTAYVDAAIVVGGLPAIPGFQIIGNNSIGGSTAVPGGITLSSHLDAVYSSAQGATLYRGASAWSALAPGTAGQQLKTAGAAANPSWSDTGLLITQHSGTIVVPSGTSGTITMDLSLGDWQIPAQCTGDFTLVLSNPTTGQQFTVVLTQGSSAHAVTWFGGITWMGAPYTAPTMPTTASAKLSATFKCISSGVYLGWWLGNSAA